MKTNYSFRGLYAITAGEQGQKLMDNAAAALTGGAQMLLYRDKTQDQSRRYSEAMALKNLCLAHNIPFLVNDDLALALAVAADGVHLGQADGDVKKARQAVPDNFIIGVTCHGSIKLALDAMAAGADYVSFGACFPSSTKPAAPPASLQTIAAARSQISIPIVAIGGITLQNAASVIATGVDMVCVISDLFNAPDIQKRASEYAKLFPVTV